jgi:hypothetical protein
MRGWQLRTIEQGGIEQGLLAALQQQLIIAHIPLLGAA